MDIFDTETEKDFQQTSLPEQLNEERNIRSLKGYWSNGNYGYIFSVYSRNEKKSWFCNVCKCYIQEAPNIHLKIAMHIQKAIGYHNQFEASGDDKRYTKDENGKQDDKGTDVVLPNKELSHKKKGQITKKAFIQARLDSFKAGPLLGVEYLVELHRRNVAHKYLCLLCDKKFRSPSCVIDHIYGYRHLQLYLLRHLPKTYHALAPYMRNECKNQWQATLKRIGIAIERKYGRLAPHFVESNVYYRTKDDISKKIINGPHFHEKNGVTFEHLVNKEDFKAIGAYKRLIMSIELEMEEELKKHEEDPQSHPKYKEEWGKFWTQRSKQLESEGKDVTIYDFQSEWKTYFSRRMIQINRVEIKEKCKKLHERLSSEDSDSPGLNYKSSQKNMNQKINGVKNMPSIKKSISRSSTLNTNGMGIQEQFNIVRLSKDCNSLEFNYKTTSGVETNTLIFDCCTNCDAHPSPGEKSSVNLIQVLRLVTNLDFKLGSFSSNIYDLLAKALLMESEESNSSENLLDNVVICRVLEVTKDKLKDAFDTTLGNYEEATPLKTAIMKITALLNYAKTRKSWVERMKSFDAKKGQLDRSVIAKEIATALVLQGKIDVTEDDLEELIDVAIEEIEAYKNANKPKTAASLEKVNLSETKTSSSCTSTCTKTTDEQNAMDQLSEFDLIILLRHYKDLSAEEQQGIAMYLKHLEIKEPERLNKLKNLVNTEIGESSSVSNNNLHNSVSNDNNQNSVFNDNKHNSVSDVNRIDSNLIKKEVFDDFDKQVVKTTTAEETNIYNMDTDNGELKTDSKNINENKLKQTEAAEENNFCCVEPDHEDGCKTNEENKLINENANAMQKNTTDDINAKQGEIVAHKESQSSIRLDNQPKKLSASESKVRSDDQLLKKASANGYKARPQNSQRFNQRGYKNNIWQRGPSGYNPHRPFNRNPWGSFGPRNSYPGHFTQDIWFHPYQNGFLRF